MILDVGCGSKSKVTYLAGNNILHVDKDKKTDADIIMDVFHLGFQSKCFNIVHTRHMIEHLSNPHLAIEEMKRVTRKTVIITVPNATYFKFFNETSHHLFSWSITTFQNFLKEHFTDLKVYEHNHRVQDSHNKLGKLKLFVLSLILGNDELTAICSVRRRSEGLLAKGENKK